MTIEIVVGVLFLLVVVSLVWNIISLVKIQNTRESFETLQKEFTELQTEFAIVGGLLAPFLKWVDDVNKQRTNMERIAKEKADALANKKKE